MTAWLAFAAGLAIGTTLVLVVAWMIRTSLKSASRAELEAAQTQLSAAKAVSDMTVTLADMSYRESQVSERMELVRVQLLNLTDVVSTLQSQLSRQSDNLTLLVDAFIQRGYLREARTPAQVGETRARPAPLSPDAVPSARVDDSRSPTEPIATG